MADRYMELLEEAANRYDLNTKVLHWEGEIAHMVKKGAEWPNQRGIIFNGPVVVVYDVHWGGMYEKGDSKVFVPANEMIRAELKCPTFGDFVEAIDDVVYRSGDHHHIFWEGGRSVVKGGTLYYAVSTGS